MKKSFGEYYIGFDVGTSSCGYAVTDTEYKVLKINNKAMWGSRLFEEAATAAETRVKRSQRRRIERAGQRIKLLQALMSEEISKVDMGFYLRQQESNLHLEDKKENNREIFSLFGKGGMTDSAFYEAYPTIYHLKKAQLEGKAEAFDIRMLYLTTAHFLKNRGHFLFDNFQIGNDDECDLNEGFSLAYGELIAMLKAEVPALEDASFCSADEVKKIIANRKANISAKKAELEKAFKAGKDKTIKAAAGFLSGGKVKLSELFFDESLKEAGSLSLKDDNIEEKESELTASIGDKFELVLRFKTVYDLAVLDELRHGQRYISEAKVEIFSEHERDLRLLKNFVKNSGDKALYKEIFGISKDNKANYSAYVGSSFNKNGKKTIIAKKSQEEFCDYLKGVLKDYVDFKNLPASDDELTKLFYRIAEKTAFPKLRTKSNGVIPVQLNTAELKAILKNAAVYLPFLNEKDETGLTVAEKILSIMEFRIPYYVGPLAGTEKTRQAKRFWIVKRSNEKITPWNFEQVVDLSKSAENFIRNMTNKCTYLYTEDVLPKQSLLYSEFEARNELNNLALNGERLKIEIIDKIFNELLIKGKTKVSKKTILQFLKRENIIGKDEKEINLSGVDDVLTSDVKSFKDFYGIFGEEYVKANREQIEDIIGWITLFAGEKKMLLAKIKDAYPQIPAEKLREIKKLSYKKWGRFSRTFLDSEQISYTDDRVGEKITIIEAMRREPLNLMQLLSKGSKYGFAEKTEAFNSGAPKPERLDYSYIKELAVSPSVKRAIWQSLQIMQEIKKITGHDPERIFIETAREEGKKERTKSRREKLEELYKAAKRTSEEFFSQEVYDELLTKDDAALKSKKLYLYFSQFGRDMYTGKKIELSELFAKTGKDDVYDLDHIFPRSKTKDDSFDNLVLVHHTVNLKKEDDYPLNAEIRKDRYNFWRYLSDKGLITQEKFNRLTRSTMLTEDELAGFISRQLVETRQSTKALAEILKLECPNSTIVYSKAGNVSDFRKQFDLIKCRDINDLHHAKDAYLNIVVGNVYYTKFTASPLNIIKNPKFRYTLNPKKLYDWEISRSGITAWKPGEEGTIATVKRIMNKNNIQVTRMVRENKGAMFGATIYKAGDGKLFPLKAGRDVNKYGGYSGQSTAYFALVESKDKNGQPMRTIEAVPIHLVSKTRKDIAVFLDYLREEFGLKEPRIIIDEIKIDSLITFDGCAANITGITGKSLTCKPANQLVIGNEWEIYFKAVLKFNARKKENDKEKITSKNVITKEKNAQLYEILAEKLKTKIYVNRPSIHAEDLEAGKKKFEALTAEEQCEVLGEILKLFQTKPLTANLTKIGKSSFSGKFLFNKKISNFKSVILHNYSVTGLFEQKPIDLLTV